MSKNELQLAMQYHKAGRFPEAEALYRQMLALEPTHPGALCMLGVLAYQTGRTKLALDLLGGAIVNRPGFADAHYHRGNILKGLNRPNEALADYRAAVNAKPDFPEAQVMLGTMLAEKGELEQAQLGFRQAIACRPAYAEAHHGLGLALKNLGQFEEAFEAARTAVSLNNQYAEAQFSLSHFLLWRGDYVPGWEAFEWRLHAANLQPSRPAFVQPKWDGFDLTGRTIFILDEGGLGDDLQMIRYVPMVAARGGRVILGCPPPLRKVLRETQGVSHWLEDGEAIPRFDCYCPLMSLPHAFRTDEQSIPASIPYVSVDVSDRERWRKVLADDPGFKVGLRWAGNPGHNRDQYRSMLLAELVPLGQVKGVSFYSLQKGDPARQTIGFSGFHLIDHTEKLHDFADTAALIANLDLVISVDTSVAHLAGAMGKPVWNMLDFVPDWRWMLDRSDTPWYPSMRLFRQTAIGNWSNVVSQVKDELVKSARKHVNPACCQ